MHYYRVSLAKIKMARMNYHSFWALWKMRCLRKPWERKCSFDPRDWFSTLFSNVHQEQLPAIPMAIKYCFENGKGERILQKKMCWVSETACELHLPLLGSAYPCTISLHYTHVWQTEGINQQPPVQPGDTLPLVCYGAQGVPSRHIGLMNSLLSLHLYPWLIFLLC